MIRSTKFIKIFFYTIFYDKIIMYSGSIIFHHFLLKVPSTWIRFQGVTCKAIKSYRNFSFV